eukprot:746558-Hanusia_phi.AAC.6
MRESRRLESIPLEDRNDPRTMKPFAPLLLHKFPSSPAVGLRPRRIPADECEVLRVLRGSADWEDEEGGVGEGGGWKGKGGRAGEPEGDEGNGKDEEDEEDESYVGSDDYDGCEAKSVGEEDGSTQEISSGTKQKQAHKLVT